MVSYNSRTGKPGLLTSGIVTGVASNATEWARLVSDQLRVGAEVGARELASLPNLHSEDPDCDVRPRAQAVHSADPGDAAKVFAAHTRHTSGDVANTWKDALPAGQPTQNAFVAWDALLVAPAMA